MNELYVRNRQRSRPINARFLERIAVSLIAQTCPADYRIGILLVGEVEMARLNEAFLQHAGPTDVLAFGYAGDQCRSLHGEVFICIDEALRQARRFRITWHKEVIRYLCHGLLHFQGYDDRTPAKRTCMKAVENALLAKAAREFCLRDLSRKTSIRL
jgi:probable rRNA maturation factor